MPWDQVDAAASRIFDRGGKNLSDQGFYFNIGIPNCQGIWPEEYGEVLSLQIKPYLSGPYMFWTSLN